MGVGGQGCVCCGLVRPSSRLAPARPVPPPSCVRVSTPALPPGVPGACSSRTGGRTPLAAARCAQSPPRTGLPQPHSRRGHGHPLHAAVPGPGTTSLGPPTRAPRSCWDFRTPGRRVPRTRARRRTHPLRPPPLSLGSPSCRHSSPLPTGWQGVPTPGRRSLLWVPHFRAAGCLEAWNSSWGKPQRASCP